MMKRWSKVDPQAPTERADYVRVWMNDLYYGEHKQSSKRLATVEKDGIGFCCLGRGCVVYGYSTRRKEEVIEATGQKIKYVLFAGESGSLPETISKFLGMDSLGDFRLSREAVLLFVKSHCPQYEVRFGRSISLSRLNDGGVPFTIIALTIREFAEHLFCTLTEAELAYIKETKLEGKHNV